MVCELASDGAVFQLPFDPEVDVQTGLNKRIRTAVLPHVPAPGSGEDWPHWRGPRSDGTWSGPKLSSNWPSKGLHRVWQTSLGGGYGGISTSGGRVYVMDRQTMEVEVERVLCYAGVDGRLLWTKSYPVDYQNIVCVVNKSQDLGRSFFIRQLINMQYERNDFDLTRGRFRVRGDTLEILPSYEELGVRIEFWGDEVERILRLDPLTGEVISDLEHIDIYPAKHFVTSQEKMLSAVKSIEDELKEQTDHLRKEGKLLEAQRLDSRTRYDLEMMEVSGYCAGIENYSRHLSQRAAGSSPYTLMDYIPDDFLLFIDESHNIQENIFFYDSQNISYCIYI